MIAARPVYDLTVGKLWLRAAIEEYGRSRNRKPGRPDRGTLMRQRVTSALLDADVTVADTRVFMGDDGRAVIMQFAALGSPQMRRRVAAKVLSALRSAGLGVTDEGSHSVGDMEGYLAEGGTAEVFDLPEAMARQA